MAANPNSQPALDLRKQFNTVEDLLLKAEARIALALPKHLTPERMIRVALTTMQRTPLLLKCSPLSLVGTVVQASELGLELNGFLGEAYMVPFFNSKSSWPTKLEAQFQAGYRGLISLARRSDLVSVIYSELVYHGDTFDVDLGTEKRIVHKPNYDTPYRGAMDAHGNLPELKGAYAVVKYKDGETDFEYLPIARLDELRNMSKARDKDNNEVGPWTKHPGEMYRKVPIRQLAKRLPLSPEFQKAAVLDEYGEAGVRQNLGAILEANPTEYKDILAEVAQDRAEELAQKYAAPRPQPVPVQRPITPSDYGYTDPQQPSPAAAHTAPSQPNEPQHSPTRPARVQTTVAPRGEQQFARGRR